MGQHSKPKKHIAAGLKAPVCMVCGQEIPKSVTDSITTWQSRQTCPKSDPKPDGERCWQIWARRPGRVTPYRHKPKEPVVKIDTTRAVEPPSPLSRSNAKPVKAKVELTEEQIAERERLELEQQAIDKAEFIRLSERCGYVCSPPRSLTPEEIAKVAPLYRPPVKPTKSFYTTAPQVMR